MRIMVIGDSHCKPGVSNARYTWLGRMALDYEPDVIVDMGDWNSMDSLCSYDKGKKEFEGRRYKHDIACGIDAREKFQEPIDDHNKRLKVDVRYTPRKVSLIGNHEVRIVKATMYTPELDGVISLDDLRLEEFGWERHDFLELVEIGGVLFSHYLKNKGAAPTAVSGKYHAAKMLAMVHKSICVAHSHNENYAIDNLHDGTKIIGLVAGCYFEHHEDYAGQDNKGWWRGINILNNVKKGNFDLEQVSIAEIKRRYK